MCGCAYVQHMGLHANPRCKQATTGTSPMTYIRARAETCVHTCTLSLMCVTLNLIEFFYEP